MEGPKIETINELQLWLEGRFDLLHQAQKSSGEDLVRVRSTVHDLSNHVQVLIALNLPDKLETFSASLRKHDEEIEKLVKDGIAHKSVIGTIRLGFAVLGAVLGTVGTLAIQLWTASHH